MSRSFEPIRGTGVFCSDHDAHTAIVFERGGVVIDVGPVGQEVERLEPMVSDLKVPVFTNGWLELDHERFVVREFPV